LDFWVVGLKRIDELEGRVLMDFLIFLMLFGFLLTFLLL